MKNVKGISPLIAAVLLIAFTMAIAGILAAWANNFANERLAVSAVEGRCLGAIDISSLAFEGTTITATVRNVADSINLTTMRLTVEYSDKTKNNEYVLSESGFPEMLGPSETAFLSVDTADATKPLSVNLVSRSCPKNPAISFFR